MAYGRYMGAVKEYDLEEGSSKLGQLRNYAQKMLGCETFVDSDVEEIPFAPSYLRATFTFGDDVVTCLFPCGYCPEEYMFYTQVEEDVEEVKEDEPIRITKN